MKLNPDCVRDILLTIEEKCDFNHVWVYDKNEVPCARLQKYSHDELIYHISQCKQAGLIHAGKYLDLGASVTIYDLTPDGHSFLANVRQDTIWNHTKTIASKIGSKSLDTLFQISSNVITQLIKAQFGLS